MSNGKGSKARCPVCRFRKRGSNHDEGKHHQAAVEKSNHTGTYTRPQDVPEVDRLS